MSDPFPQSLTDELIARYWDDTIDGDKLSLSDIESFLDPFLNTIRLQQAQ